MIVYGALVCCNRVSLFQVLLPLMQSDLYTVAMACVKQTLHNVPVEFHTRMYAVAVVSVSKGYPGAYNKGVIISGDYHIKVMLRYRTILMSSAIN